MDYNLKINNNLFYAKAKASTWVSNLYSAIQCAAFHILIPLSQSEVYNKWENIHFTGLRPYQYLVESRPTN